MLHNRRGAHSQALITPDSAVHYPARGGTTSIGPPSCESPPAVRQCTAKSGRASAKTCADTKKGGLRFQTLNQRERLMLCAGSHC